MTHATGWKPAKINANQANEDVFDLVRGIAAYTGSGLIASLAETVSRHPDASFARAFSHKQVASKSWARDKLFDTLGGQHELIWIMGGWYGVLPAMLFEDPRFVIDAVESFDLDPAVASIARSLNAAMAGENRFRSRTADMYKVDYLSQRPNLVINTSCEHIPDIRAWLDLLPAGTPVLLQSNDYFAEPSHINCKPSVEAFLDDAKLTEVLYSGTLPTKRYRRFMLIGRV